MKLRLVVPSLAALLLMPVVASAQGRPPSEPGDIPRFNDDRQPITLMEHERAFIRREMRGFLDGIREILDAAAAGDRARVVAAARRAGMNGPESDHIPKSLGPKLPMEFKQLGLATHRGFDQIAQEVERSDASQAPRRVADIMGNCVACHATWRVDGAAPIEAPPK